MKRKGPLFLTLTTDMEQARSFLDRAEVHGLEGNVSLECEVTALARDFAAPDGPFSYSGQIVRQRLIVDVVMPMRIDYAPSGEGASVAVERTKRHAKPRPTARLVGKAVPPW